MAKEYIERGKALSDDRWNSVILSHDRERVREIILCQPAADVIEVVHGRWISDDRDVLFSCSECGTQISTSWDYDDLQWNFCPHCGCKMDGGKNNVVD